MTGAGGEGEGEGVSVVVPHYGGASLAEGAVSAVRDQHGDRPVQLIVVDDHSPEPFAPRPGVTVIRHDLNLGFGAAINTGAAHALHPWLLVLNSDVTMPPGTLDRLVAAGRSTRPSVSSPLLIESGRPTSTANRWPAAYRGLGALQPLARWSQHAWMRRLVGFDVDCVAGRRRRTDWLTGACLLMQTADFWAVGGFDERFHMYFEEVDLQRRLARHGVPAYFVGDVAVTHLGGGTTGWGGRVRALSVSATLYARIWGFHRRATLVAATVSAVNLAYNVLRRLSGRPTTPLRSIRTDFGHLAAGLSESRAALRRPSGRPLARP
ncbi:glycosyltransferase family 2 protein [Marmoricola endophyticus]|uniref:glycosyltransferase family 2 protein n=1 Tax=Marmoricola endophyticus TaxID=2040280 RepID=UPI00166AE6B7|nr:glycosyltransferase family 2 protein [Marmoricola endophyticus]